MSEYFYSQIKDLKDAFMFKRGIMFGFFTWIFCCLMAAMAFSWVVADILSKD